MLRKSLRSLLLLASAPALFLACSGDDEEIPIEPTPEAALIIDRTTVEYGELEVGQTSPEQLFTVRNASPTAVEKVNVLLEGTSFVITANTCERFLDAGRECQVRVKFAPTLAGSYVTRLRVQGAPEVDHATLNGTAFAMLDIRVNAPNAQVVVGADAYTCSTACRIPIRTPEVKLLAAPTGFPTWGGACSAATMGCAVRMDGPKQVSLESIASVLQWEQRWVRHPRNVAVIPGGDIVVEDSEEVSRLSGTGQVRWTRSAPSSRGMGVDGSGNVYVLSYTGRVTKYDAHGTELWSYLTEVATLSAERLAVTPSGHVYVAGLSGSYEVATQIRLVALSAQGALRWSHTFNEGQFNFIGDMGVDSSSSVYLSGSVLRREGTTNPPTFISEKQYFRKFNPEGGQVWETSSYWSSFEVGPSGVTSVIFPSGSAVPGGFAQWVVDASGNTSQARTSFDGVGTAQTQAFTPDGKLLVGGYLETISPGSSPGRGWFTLMNMDTRTLGPATYIEMNQQGGVNLTSLALLPSGSVLVAGGYGSTYSGGAGFVRVYDPRVLTTDFSATK